MTKRAHFFLFFVILAEGYVVLSYELLAIRQMLPFAGAATDSVSVIIAAVLMPLAWGYYKGGQFKPYTKRTLYKDSYIGYREKLARNVKIASIFILLGLSTLLMSRFFYFLNDIGIQSRLLLTLLFSVFFVMPPVYLLGQTIPIISNFFPKRKLSHITGKILFFSTLGSFFGAILTSAFFMPLIGVNYTALTTLALLCCVLALIGGRKKYINASFALCVFLVGWLLNSEAAMKTMFIISSNQHNTVKIYDTPSGQRVFSVNNNISSILEKTSSEKSNYITYIENYFIRPRLDEKSPPMNILVIGAGGFSLGLFDNKNHYDFVDIDPDLKDLAENHFLEEKLGANKNFHVSPIRPYLNSTNKRYDLVVMDVFQSLLTVPEHLLTQEFFASVRKVMKPRSIAVMNMNVSNNLASRSSIKIDNTVRSVFPVLSRHPFGLRNGWESEFDVNNILYIAHLYPATPYGVQGIYTDNHNSFSWDRDHRPHQNGN